MPERVSTGCADAREEQARAMAGEMVWSVVRSMVRSTVPLSATRFRSQYMAPRAQTRQPSREQFVHLLFGKQVFDSAKHLGQRRGATAGPLHFRQQPIAVVGLHRPLIDLD